jgi:glycosyltransferase involved in cell wall biosynthesis
MKCSILINTFNHEGYIAACVDSALAQTRPAEEVIVVDDGSTDRTPEILAAYGSRIRVLRRPTPTLPAHASQAEAISAAFALSTGALVFFLDGDDTFLPGKVAAYSAAFKEHPDVAVLQGPVLRMDRRGQQLSELRHPAPRRGCDLRRLYARQRPLHGYAPDGHRAVFRAYPRSGSAADLLAAAPRGEFAAQWCAP